MPQKERMTIEDLAGIIQNDVVSQMATKDDLSQLEKRLTTRLDDHEHRLDHIDEHITDLRSDFRNLNTTQSRLVTTLAAKRILTMGEAHGLSGA